MKMASGHIRGKTSSCFISALRVQRETTYPNSKNPQG